MEKLSKDINGKRLRIPCQKCIKRSIPRDKYWIITNDTQKEGGDNGIYYFKKIRKIDREILHFSNPYIRRYYRKTEIISKLPKLELTSSDRYESSIFTSASAGLVQMIPLSYVTCSYTDRVLKPFIFQDFENHPLWLKMHSELLSKVAKKFPNLRIRKKNNHPVNYMYIQKEHIPAINVLAEAYFWPGINISSALWYPEFSCVAMYKKLVVGFGIMAPGLHLNEAYINFLFVRPFWRNSGIASFILYHLSQTCISWNITLHTSLSNDAIFLYNKFTFKVHKMIRDFYGERIPLNSNKSGHAFYSQLQKYLVD